MRLANFSRTTLTLAAAAAALAVAFAADEPAKGGVRALLELNRDFYYAGDPITVRVSLGNEGGAPVPNPVKAPLLRGFTLRRGGTVVKPTGTASAQEPTRVEKLAPSSFYGTVVDLTEIYPELRKPGEFAIQWENEGVRSNELQVKLIDRLDPDKDYQARIETSEGAFTIEFFKKAAPLAYKAFTDLAKLGYYDGLLVHEVRPEVYVAAGDAALSGTPRFPFSFPQEQSTLPVVAGTVLMRPMGAAPPTNGAPFMVVLRADPAMIGQATVVGQVVDGMDVVTKMSRLPSSERTSRPFFRPLKDIKIQKVTILERATTGQAQAQ